MIIEMQPRPHVFHLKSERGTFILYPGDTYDKVVTAMWSYDSETKYLRYGATVYKKGVKSSNEFLPSNSRSFNPKSDIWIGRKRSLATARVRYENSPIYVHLPDARITERVMEIIGTFIVNSCINRFGHFNKKIDSNESICSRSEEKWRKYRNINIDKHRMIALWVYGTPLSLSEEPFRSIFTELNDTVNEVIFKSLVTVGVLFTGLIMHNLAKSFEYQNGFYGTAAG